MKYERLITGQEFFQRSDRPVGMPCGGMRNLESHNNVRGMREKVTNGVRKVQEDSSEGEGKKRSGQEVEEEKEVE